VHCSPRGQSCARGSHSLAVIESGRSTKPAPVSGSSVVVSLVGDVVALVPAVVLALAVLVSCVPVSLVVESISPVVSPTPLELFAHARGTTSTSAANRDIAEHPITSTARATVCA
jgi:hypothetical protein